MLAAESWKNVKMERYKVYPNWMVRMLFLTKRAYRLL